MPTYLDRPVPPYNADPVLELVMDRFKVSQDAHARYHRRTTRFYNLYRGWYRGTFDPHRNNTALPLLFATLWSDVARKANVLFSEPNRAVGIFGYGPEDAAIARKNEILLNAQLFDAGIYEKTLDVILSSGLYGTAITMDGWKWRQERLPQRVQRNTPITDQLVEDVEFEDRVLFDGPDLEVIDVLDFFPEPNVPRLEDMRWAIRRHWMDFDDLKKKAEEGFYSEASIRQIEMLGMKDVSMAALKDRFAVERHNLASNERDSMIEKFAKPVELLEMWGVVPDELIPEDGCRHRVITVANGKTVVRNRPNPYWHGELPFKAHRALPDPHFFYGPGKVEITEKLMASVNRISNAKLDVLDTIIDPIMAYNREMDVDTDELYLRPGRFIGVEGNPNEAIMPIIPDTRGVQLAYSEIEQLWRWMQQSSGIVEDTVMGGQSGGRQTAREFLGRQENVSVRLLLETRILEELWLNPMVNRWRSLNQQFLTTPRETRILGGNLIDPVTQEQVPLEAVTVFQDDLNRDYDVRALGSTQTLPRAVKQQNMVLLTQALTAHPVAFQFINWIAFFRDMLRTFEFRNVDELTTVPQQQQDAIAQANAAGQGSLVSPGEATAITPSM